MKQHTEPMARLEMLMLQVDEMHRQVAAVAHTVTELLLAARRSVKQAAAEAAKLQRAVKKGKRKRR